MKKFLLIVVGFVLCAWMTSCYTTQNVFLNEKDLSEQFGGKTKKEIIQMMGPPTRETTDGGDGSILVYEYNTESYTNTTTNYNQYTNTKKEQSSTNYVNKFVHIYFNSENICVGVRHNYLTKQVRTYDSGMTTGVVLSSGLIIIGVFCLIMAAVTS